MRRVSRRQVVFTWDQAVAAREFWFVRDYLPEVNERERGLAALDAAVLGLGPDARVLPVPVPHDCRDGFFAAYWRRPEAYLDPVVRAGISGLALLDQGLVERAVTQLATDLADGTWAARYADLIVRDELDVGYCLVVAG
jgi:hypothetical protein